MQKLLGEYECKLDEKGRMRLPSGLISQLGERETYAFVINRGFEKCLMLYTEEVWDQITNEINALNLYVKKNRDFVRYFYRGANKVVMDSADRILLAKRLLEYAEIEKDAILLAYNNRIEIWSAEQYDQMLQEEPDDFSGLAEGVMELSGLSKPEAP
ncbi:MAG: division/cell wall cluster transcriptional repressor MraZ [Haliscomenobacter sp.]|jgi:MraZ protein